MINNKNRSKTEFSSVMSIFQWNCVLSFINELMNKSISSHASGDMMNTKQLQKFDNAAAGAA
ncbi:MAG: hypothetical protein LBC02_03240 [Planctomycetaceae bacterium]|jgi:hypothetical protein|nr:hypothetical protein [Planctomycetaceae bacterium]